MHHIYLSKMKNVLKVPVIFPYPFQSSPGAFGAHTKERKAIRAKFGELSNTVSLTGTVQFEYLENSYSETTFLRARLLSHLLTVFRFIPCEQDFQIP